ncbi:MAG: aspartate-semialdehyde dehydrogenase, partial [Thermodesulfobacteriota bacterium]
MKKDKYNVAIIGSTGAVGQEMIEILGERNFPIGELRLLASKRSAGKEQKVNGNILTVRELDHDCFEDIDIALFSAGATRSREYAESAVKAGAVVIDNSSAYRLDEDVPLIIPEINPDSISDYRKKGIIANPNCTTAVTVMALKPLHDLAHIKRVVATSFQAVSGAGAGGISELEDQTKAWIGSENIESTTFPHPIAFNVIPHIDVFQENSYTKEEMKFHYETRKILGDESINLTATTVRVPVFRAHSVSVNIETEIKVSADMAKEAFDSFPGIRVVDDPDRSLYPMPIDAAGKDECLVGRIREDFTVE